jgi:hypothetical protein
MFITITVKIFLLTGICGIAAAFANPEYGTYRFGQHLGIGAGLALICDFGLGWFLGPLFSEIGGGWLLYYVLTGVILMVVAIPAGMFVYAFDFRQARIFALLVAAVNLLLSLALLWAVGTG